MTPIDLIYSFLSGIAFCSNNECILGLSVYDQVSIFPTLKLFFQLTSLEASMNNYVSFDFSVFKPCSELELLNLTSSTEDENIFREDLTYISQIFDYHNGSSIGTIFNIYPEEGGCVDRAHQLHLNNMIDSAIHLLYHKCRNFIDNPKELMWNPYLENFLQNISRTSLKLSYKHHHIKIPNDKEQILFPRILHVATELYPSGGHTRVLLSFAQFLNNRSHQLFLTKNSTRPPIINEVFHANQIFSCKQHNLDCARNLRLTAMYYDLVILHVHMQDVIPTIAFGRGYTGPPVVLFDHADHQPWSGSTVLHARLVYRQAAFRLSAARGLELSRNIMIPLPAGDPFRQYGGKEESRRTLGFKPHQIVLLTMSSVYKFNPHTTTFIQILVDILKDNPNVVLVSVNAPKHWKTFLQSHNVSESQYVDPGVVVGKQSIMYHAAADIHLDSFPFSSITSMLESILDGGVAISFCPWTSLSKLILCVETADYGNIIDSTMPNPVLSCRTRDAYKNALNALVQSPELLRSLQNLTTHSMRRHTGQGWATAMEEVFDKINQLPRTKPWKIQPHGKIYQIGPDGRMI
eukprot:gene1572-3040_t